MNFVNGVDVSDFQGDVPWANVKAAGYSWASAKATEGVNVINDTFADNRNDVRALGMPFCAYHYMGWHSDPVAQAKHFLSVYQPANGDLPPMLDCEACVVGPDAASAQISGFLKIIEPHLNGAKMLLYWSLSFPDDHLPQGGAGFSGHSAWIAAYNRGIVVPTPDAWAHSPYGGKVVAWQWSDGQTPPAPPIPGMGNVDRDRFIGSLDDLRALTLRGLT